MTDVTQNGPEHSAPQPPAMIDRPAAYSGQDAFRVDRPQAGLWFERRSDVLVVSFDNLGTIGGRTPPIPWFYHRIVRGGFSVLGVLGKRKDWYRNADTAPLLSELADTGFFEQFRRVVFVGASMGGFAALTYARIVPGASVVAFSPQSTLWPELAPFESRYDGHRKKTDWDTPQFRDAAESIPVLADVVLAYDPFVPEDRAHARRLSGPNVYHLHLDHFGHKAVRLLKSAGALQLFFEQAVKGELKPALLGRRIHAGRRGLRFWQRALFAEAKKRGHIQLLAKAAERLSALYPDEAYPKRVLQRIKPMAEAQRNEAQAPRVGPATAASPDHAAKRAPRNWAGKNIMLISFDDAIAPWPQAHAFQEPLQTPNLDRICKQSTAFHAAYCQAPVCGPSRASLMTAKTPHESGVLENSTRLFDKVKAEDVWTFGLKENGYFCSSGGKVHHGPGGTINPQIHPQLYSDGRKRFSGDINVPHDLALKKFGGHRNGWATTDPKDDETFYDHQAATSAISFLNTYNQSGPFYREVGFFSPHGPHVTPARFKEMYDVDNFQPPQAWADGFDDHPLSDQLFPQNPHIQNGDMDWWRCSVRNYFSAYSHGDYHLGRVWDALQASPHAANTVVIILADHGFHLGNRNRYMKSTLWEQVARVPLIIYDPDDPVGREIHDPVALLDVGPTVLDLLGLPGIGQTRGCSLRPLLEGQGAADRAIPTVRPQSASARIGPYRFVYYEDGSTQLFDLRNDFWQLHDLGSSHPDYQTIKQRFFECCLDYGMSFEGGPAG